MDVDRGQGVKSKGKGKRGKDKEKEHGTSKDTETEKGLRFEGYSGHWKTGASTARLLVGIWISRNSVETDTANPPSGGESSIRADTCASCGTDTLRTSGPAR